MGNLKLEVEEDKKVRFDPTIKVGETWSKEDGDRKLVAPSYFYLKYNSEVNRKLNQQRVMRSRRVYPRNRFKMFNV